MKRVYLAGPDVFLPNAAELLRQKAELARSFGFQPSGSAEDDLNPTGLTKYEFGQQIARWNEKRMDESDFIVANLTPFRGISADVGTAYEVGYMRARGKPVFAYTNVAGDYYSRLTDQYYAGAFGNAANDVIRGSDGLMIEDHGMIDNLMLDTAVSDSGGVFVRGDVGSDGDVLGDLVTFRACLAAASRHWSETA